MRASKKKYTCVIVDDDVNAIQVLKAHISIIPKLSLIAAHTNPIQAIAEVKGKGYIDFLLLDINMRVSGLDVALRLREYARFIIFVTGHPEYALAAFNAEADRFLSKPVSLPKFIITINQLLYHKIRNRL
ncbi:LytR/AlgR family response regulator transcription factor [Pedobacter lithocola]|uniref:LytR/AlgR family response regulator transcription factor n=1 Tax=Pedobacter lithocola TaxID=1908239 RepID=A0ABV8P3C4_9SPHI